MAKSLVIVESPAKASTINKLLGKDYTVKASMGHVRDLPKKKIGVDEAHDFAPTYEILPGREKIMGELRKAAAAATHIFIATDPDREGEAIGWHLAEELDPENKKTQRVTFNEITKQAVGEAFKHPRKIDIHRVDAQQARRILDRLLGYKISPLLWKKVRRGLSAGRVQSVTLKMVCDREREIKAFVPEEWWSIEALLAAKLPPEFVAKLTRQGEEKIAVTNAEQAGSIRTALEAAVWRVLKVERKKRTRNPPPPFITSKLQQDAARQLHFPVKKTMSVAQRLYEGVNVGADGTTGLITYMRTDSTRVAEEALLAVREYIKFTYGDTTMPEVPRRFTSRKGAQDAHEAIRPTSLNLPPETIKAQLSPDEFRLYRLIWNRFVASQMNPALYDQTAVDVEAMPASGKPLKGGNYIFRASGSVLIEKGYLAVYQEESDATQAGDDADTTLPLLAEGEVLDLRDLKGVQHFTEPPPRYTEASLVKALEENGIGRPSTYAAILSTIQSREYTVKEDNKFAPTELGFLVMDLLNASFADVLDIGYTARLEEKLDAVEDGEANWIELLSEFNEKFLKDLALAATEMRDVKREETPTGENCERCNSPMVKKFGRFGSFIACSNYPECKNTKEIAGEGGPPAPETPEGVAPCEKCGGEMAMRRGRFGHFLACVNYPKCKTTRRIVQDASGQVRAAEVKLLDEACPECGKPLAQKHGRFGDFISCSNYPECKYIKPKEVGVACTKEGCAGALIERRSKRGKVFYGCSAYPKCDFVLWNKPLAEKCPSCDAPFLVEKVTKKGTSKACMKEGCGYKVAAVEV